MRSLFLALFALSICGCYAANHSSDFTPLADAARAGDAAEIRALIGKGADPNAIAGSNDWTPLLHAIHKRQAASVAALLDGGADINRSGGGGYTPLMMASGYGYTEIVQLLLTRGGNALVTNPAGETALDWALTGANDIDEFTLLKCQDETVLALHKAAPAVRPSSSARRLAGIKRCRSLAVLDRG